MNVHNSFPRNSVNGLNSPVRSGGVIPSPFRLGGRGSKNLSAALAENSPSTVGIATTQRKQPPIRNYFLYKGEPQPSIVQLLSKASGTYVQPLKPNPTNPRLLLPSEGQVWTVSDENLYPVELIPRHFGLELICDSFVHDFVQNLHPNKRYAFPRFLTPPNHILTTESSSLIYFDDEDTDEEQTEKPVASKANQSAEDNHSIFSPIARCEPTSTIDSTTHSLHHIAENGQSIEQVAMSTPAPDIFEQLLETTSEADLLDISSMVDTITQSDAFLSSLTTFLPVSVSSSSNPSHTAPPTLSKETLLSPAPITSTYHRPPRPPSRKVLPIQTRCTDNITKREEGCGSWDELCSPVDNHPLPFVTPPPPVVSRDSPVTSAHSLEIVSPFPSYLSTDLKTSPVPAIADSHHLCFTPSPRPSPSTTQCLCPAMNPTSTSTSTLGSTSSPTHILEETDDWTCHPQNLKEEFPSLSDPAIIINALEEVLEGMETQDNEDYMSLMDEKKEEGDQKQTIRPLYHRLKPIKSTKCSKLRKKMTNLGQVFRERKAA